MASATLRMWWAPVLELPAAPKLSVIPLPPKLSSLNSVPSLFHWKTMGLAQSCQMGAAIIKSWLRKMSAGMPLTSGEALRMSMTGNPPLAVAVDLPVAVGQVETAHVVKGFVNSQPTGPGVVPAEEAPRRGEEGLRQL